MKRNHRRVPGMLVVAGVLAAVLVGMQATIVTAQETSPFALQSRCTYNDALVLDPSANRNARVCLRQDTKAGCEQYNFCVWRDATSQNTLAEHSASEYPGTVQQVPTSTGIDVRVYQSAAGPNVTAIMAGGPYGPVLLTGPGGGRVNAYSAYTAFRANVDAFSWRTLAGVVLPHVNEEDSWGSSAWLNLFQEWAAPVYASASFDRAYQQRGEVKAAYQEREDRAYNSGLDCKPSDPSQPTPCMSPWSLPWGPDSFLGTGSMREYRPYYTDLQLSTMAAYVHPTIRISEETDITLDGHTVTLIPTSEEDAGLLVYLPAEKILIAGNLGKFLPDAGSIVQRSVPVEKWMATLDKMRTLAGGHAPDYLILGRGRPIVGSDAVNAALTVQYDALKYLHDETLKWANWHLPLADIVATVKLPVDLASGPYAAELVSTEAGIIRTVYYDHFGWFDGDAANLESLSTIEQASRLIDFGGGENGVLSYINKCITEHSRKGALQAVKMAGVLRLVHPSADVDALYVQALRFLAWTTPSAHLRNYYLTEVQKVLNPSLFVQQ